MTATRRRLIPIDRLEELADSGLTCRQIASMLGFTPDAIRRAMRKHGVGKLKPTTIGSEKRERAELLLHEGMPLAWVVEEVGVGRSTVSGIASTMSESGRTEEWRKIWPTIFRNPALLALHLEFAPRVRA